MAGPFKDFRLKIDSERKQPKGFGFCHYKDPDVASSALRNLKKYEIMGRPLKVDFASDNKNGNNLKRENVLFRDTAEIIKVSGNTTSSSQQQNSSLACEVLDSQNSTVDEILDNLSEDQEELMLACVKEVYSHICKDEMNKHEIHDGRPRARTAFIEALAADETMLKRLTEMLEKYKNRSNLGGQRGPHNMGMGGGGNNNGYRDVY